MENLRVFNRKNTDMRPNLEPICNVINNESTLLEVDLATIEQSFDNGLAVALVPEGREDAVGFVRFTPLLDDNLKQRLGIPDLPSIWEIGSAAIAPEYRGKGLYAPVRNNLLSIVSEEIAENKLLVLGTTKSIAVIKVLEKAKELGINFYQSVHTDFPMIGRFTCICTPDFGCGFQLMENCPVRVTAEQLPQLDYLAKNSQDGTKIPCVMYVSDKSLSSEVNDALMVKFAEREGNPLVNLVEALKGANYYG